jgi:aminoglycoside phosphotransferase (APT) family kinase protein
MLTTEIPGRAIGHGSYGPDMRRIVGQAGQALAQIHTIAVCGFGWIQRQDEVVTELRAEYPTHQEWIEQHVSEPLRALGQRGVLAARDVQAISLMMAEAAQLFGAEPAVLAHGDFDVTHIYQHQGRFAGIIDFGEIRGADRLYDFGHFQIENADLLPDLLAGYAEVHPLPSDYMRRILVTSLLIAVRRLGRRVARDADIYEPDLRAIEHTLRALT